MPRVARVHALNGLDGLSVDEIEVGAIIIGDYTRLQEGDEVRATGKLLQVPVGKGPLTPGGAASRRSGSNSAPLGTPHSALLSQQCAWATAPAGPCQEALRVPS